MKQAKFPKDFLWGAALSNVQAEGAYLEDGKGLTVYDTLIVNHEIENSTISDTNVASDHYHHYKEDIDLMAEMGFTAYRFSIVWARIHPNGDDAAPNEKGLKFYEDMIDYLHLKGIEPIVSLVHFDMPDHLLRKYNGFYNRKVVDLYENHVRIIANRLKGKVKFWITYNEVNTIRHHSQLVAGAIKPEGVSKAEFLSVLTQHTQLAHAKAVLAIKSACPEANVSGMITFGMTYPISPKPCDVRAANMINNFVYYLTFDVMVFGKYPDYYKAYMKNRKISLNYSVNDMKTIKQASRKLDFLSVSYYQTGTAHGYETSDPIEEEDLILFGNDTLVRNPYLKTNEWGWQIDPEGFRTTLSSLHQRYHKPIFVVENGIGIDEKLNEQMTVEDDQRIAYQRSHIENMLKSIILDGSKIIGYLAWAPIDFLSSHKEMRKRYGFVYINRTDYELKDLKRYRKKSFFWYKKVIASNGSKLD